MTTAFEKAKSKDKDGKEQETWKQVAPAAKDVDQTKVENLIAAVTQARASSFVDAAPKSALDKPELTVTIKSNDGKREEKVTFGRAGTDVVRRRERASPAPPSSTPRRSTAIIKALEEIK